MRVLQTAVVILFSAATFSGAAPQDTEGKDKVFLCYWGSWSHYRHGNGAFSVDQIDSMLCTHLVYTFAKLENGVIKEYDPYLDLAKPWHLGMYKKFNNLKLGNPKLKTIIAIGGWNEGSIKYSKMASTFEGRAKFVKSVVDFLEFHGFDGLDMDWEYPTQRGGNPEDRDNFIKLLSELRAAFDERNYLLTAAVSAGIPTANASYDIPQLSKLLDLISVMGYDFFGAWQRYTGHNSPLRARKGASELEKIFNIEAALEFWMSHGVDTNKLVLGLPLYGRTFTLADPADSGFGAPTVGPGRPGTFTNEPGFVGYNEICTQLKSGDWNVTRDPDVNAPVATKDREWIGFDDAESLTKKVEFAMSKNLTGIMVWSIETDDFRGACTGTVNPLLSAINKALQLPQAERLLTPPTPTSTSIVWWTPQQKAPENAQSKGKDKVFLCYWGSWSHYRHGNGAFSVDQIDSMLCTHLVYTFAKLENGVIKEYDPYLDLAKPWHLGMYKKFNNLKLGNPKLKTIIAIGGWNEGSIKYSKMASTFEGRAKFVKSVVDFLELHGFDGLDMDWEYPTQRGGNPEDRDNFIKLLSELRAAFDERNYLLTAAVSAGIPTANASYDIPQLSKLLDLISVMGYDFFGAWQRYTGHNSPLRARKGASELEKIFNIEAALEFWMSHGADTNKLVLGLPLYGRTFTLADPADSGFGALTVGPGRPGTFTNEPGFVGYNEICTQLKSGDWNVTRDPDVNAPVATKDREWIGFDDAESLTKKVEFAMSKNLTGIMVWSIETDDFRGACTGTVNPLLSAINKALQLPQAERLLTPPTPTSTSIVWWTPQQKAPENAQSSVSKQEEENTGTTQPPTTQENKEQSNTEDLPCNKIGWFAHPLDPRKFYACIGENGVFKTYVLKCGLRTVYDQTTDTCVYEFL